VTGNSYYWHNETDDVSAFEDTSEGLWYAWAGTPDEHDDAGHSHALPTRDEAVENLYAIIEGTIEP
jgi:hypothetical protein